jgi:sensor domain CHASE-containing protein
VTPGCSILNALLTFAILAALACVVTIIMSVSIEGRFRAQELQHRTQPCRALVSERITVVSANGRRNACK